MGMQPYLAADLHAGRLVEIFPARGCFMTGMYFACRKERTASTKSPLSDWLLNEVSADPISRSCGPAHTSGSLKLQSLMMLRLPVPTTA